MTTPSKQPEEARSAPSARTAADISDWLTGKLAEAMRVAPTDVSPTEPLIGMGLDSMQFVVLVGELEQWLGCRFTDNPLIDHPTVETLSEYLADQLALGKTLIDPAER